MGRLKIPPCRRIRGSALVVLALWLSPFAYGQSPVVGSTNLPIADVSRRSLTEVETVVLPKSVPDPIEPFNRVMWSFNKGLMTDVIKPTSRVYRFVVVKPIRTGIGNFGKNLTYDKRALSAWTGLATGLVFVCYFFTPPAGAHLADSNLPINLNYLYGFNDQQPQTWINQNLYVILWLGVLWLVAFLPTHLVLRKIFAKSPPAAGSKFPNRCL